MEQQFTVFGADGTSTEVAAWTYGRDGADWVLYNASGDEVDRFPASAINGMYV